MNAADWQRWLTCIHESGHMIVGAHMGLPSEAQLFDGGGLTHSPDYVSTTMHDALQEAAMLHAGTAAEMIGIPRRVRSSIQRVVDSNTDEVKILSIAWHRGGNNLVFFNDTARQWAIAILSRRWREVERVAWQLFKFGNATVGDPPARSAMDEFNSMLTASYRASLGFR